MNNERQNYALVHDIDWETEIPTSTLTYLTYEDVDIENGDNLSKYMATIANTKPSCLSIPTTSPLAWTIN